HDARPFVIPALVRAGLLAAATILMSGCQASDGAGSITTARGSLVGPMQCAAPLPSGPPDKPARMTTFGTAAAWNVGRSVGRNALTGAGTFVAGPVGGAVAGGIAARALPSTFDIRGNWTVTDGTPDCG